MKRLLLLSLSLIFAHGVHAQGKFDIACGPYLQNVTPNQATLVYFTNQPAVAWVELAPDDGSHFYAAQRPQFFQTAAGQKEIGTLHRIQLQGLKPGTTYRYRVFATQVTEFRYGQVTYGKNVASNVFTEEPFQFRTPDPLSKTVRFSVINDIHQNAKLQESLLGHADLKNLDFVVFNGDMVNHMDSTKQIFDSFLSQAATSFACEVPFLYTRGNHETRGVMANQFNMLFPTPTSQPYFCVRRGPAYFIMLDAGEDKASNDIQYFGLGLWDQYRQCEQQWLKKVVESEEFKSAPVKIVFMHIPPSQSMWYGALQAKELFVPILNQAGIDLMISGHLHKHIYVEPSQECNFPLLINSSKHVVNAEVSGETITLKVVDQEGKTVKEIKL